MYDLAIIGAGPGGFAAAIKAAESGLKVCLIEKDSIGGTCLNWGCIPTKSIIESIKVLHSAKRARDFGINIQDAGIDFSQIQKRKNDVVTTLRNGAESLLKAKRIDIIKAQARLKDKNTIETENNSISAKNIIIATGSVPAELENIKFDHKKIISSKDALELSSLPSSITIIGGGFIGCEFASIFNKLGLEVTIVELMDRLLPGTDSEISRRLQQRFKRDNIEIKKSSKVTDLKVEKKAIAKLEDGSSIESDIVLMCVGRTPNTAGLNLERIGIKTEKNRIIVDNRLKTSVPNIYAIGDAIDGYLLAHVATYEAMIAADNILGKEALADYTGIPSSIFTHPEISSVGITEDRAKEMGLDYKVTKLPLAEVSKAHIMGETEGLIKLITEADGKRILGAHIMGALASELISDFAISIKNGLSADELSDTVYAHPTLSEGIWDLVKRIE
ncbi:MAG: dihydrolipoyl dehydrogenase [Candidatus Omnitrophica bacterium]|nr:dihydrolipoyl dehydrogenase [Candidatus Omnitrophota bacterium]